MLKSIALNNDWDVATTDTDAGLITMQLACDHRAVYQLVRTGLIANKADRAIENPLWIRWSIYLEYGAPLQLLATQILALVGLFRGVESVDISDAEINTDNGILSITGICPTIDCNHRSLQCEVNA